MAALSAACVPQMQAVETQPLLSVCLQNVYLVRTLAHGRICALIAVAAAGHIHRAGALQGV